LPELILHGSRFQLHTDRQSAGGAVGYPGMLHHGASGHDNAASHNATSYDNGNHTSPRFHLLH
jgi:hypothetical protein